MNPVVVEEDKLISRQNLHKRRFVEEDIIDQYSILEKEELFNQHVQFVSEEMQEFLSLILVIPITII